MGYVENLLEMQQVCPFIDNVSIRKLINDEEDWGHSRGPGFRHVTRLKA